MKKWIHSVIAVLLASICLLPSAAFAADNTDTVPEGGYIAADPTEDDVIFTQEDLLILDAAEDYGMPATGCPHQRTDHICHAEVRHEQQHHDHQRADQMCVRCKEVRLYQGSGYAQTERQLHLVALQNLQRPV